MSRSKLPKLEQKIRQEIDRLTKEYEGHKKRYTENISYIRKICPHSNARLENDGIGMDSWIECPACGWTGERWPEVVK